MVIKYESSTKHRLDKINNCITNYTVHCTQYRYQRFKDKTVQQC